MKVQYALEFLSICTYTYFAGVDNVTDVRNGDRRFSDVRRYDAQTRSGWRRLEHLLVLRQVNTRTIFNVIKIKKVIMSFIKVEKFYI